jgi:hypothetical protein
MERSVSPLLSASAPRADDADAQIDLAAFPAHAADGAPHCSAEEDEGQRQSKVGRGAGGELKMEVPMQAYRTHLVIKNPDNVTL